MLLSFFICVVLFFIHVNNNKSYKFMLLRCLSGVLDIFTLVRETLWKYKFVLGIRFAGSA